MSHISSKDYYYDKEKKKYFKIPPAGSFEFNRYKELLERQQRVEVEEKVPSDNKLIRQGEYPPMKLFSTGSNLTRIAFIRQYFDLQPIHRQKVLNTLLNPILVDGSHSTPPIKPHRSYVWAYSHEMGLLHSLDSPGRIFTKIFSFGYDGKINSSNYQLEKSFQVIRCIRFGYLGVSASIYNSGISQVIFLDQHLNQKNRFRIPYPCNIQCHIDTGIDKWLVVGADAVLLCKENKIKKVKMINQEGYKTDVFSLMTPSDQTQLNLLWVGTRGGGIYLKDLREAYNKRSCPRFTHPSTVDSIEKLNSSNYYFISKSMDGTLSFCDIRSKKPLQIWKNENESVVTVPSYFSISPDSNYLAVSNDKHVNVFDIHNVSDTPQIVKIFDCYPTSTPLFFTHECKSGISKIFLYIYSGFSIYSLYEWF